MSKIFDAIARNGVINVSDLEPADYEERISAANAAEVLPPPTPSRVDVAQANRTLRLRASASSPVFPFADGQQHAAEEYRLIRTKILHHPRKPQILVVSSATSGDGKTVTAINIAASMALKSDSHILLVDGDLRFPRVAEELDLPITPGLTDILSGDACLDSALIRCEQFPQLFVVPAGTAALNPSELLDSENWKKLLAQFRSRFTTIILDAPPIASVADHEILQLTADGIILVIRPDHSDRSAVRKALEGIPKEKMLGAVVNCVDDWWLWKSSTSNYYYRDYKTDRKS